MTVFGNAQRNRIRRMSRRGRGESAERRRQALGSSPVEEPTRRFANVRSAGASDRLCNSSAVAQRISSCSRAVGEPSTSAYTK